MTAVVEDRLSAAARATFADVAAVLIPGGEGMPSAADVDVAGELLDRVLAIRPQAAAALPAILETLATAGGSASDRLRHLQATDPAGFALLGSLVVGAYFLDERARASIGYPGQGPREVTFEDETGYLAEGLLDPVLARGERAP